MSPIKNMTTSSDSDKISVFNDAVRLHINIKLNTGKAHVISTIRNILKDTIENNKDKLKAKRSFEESFKEAKILSEAFFQEHITEEKLSRLANVASRIQKLIINDFSQSIKKTLMEGLEGQFFGLLSLNTETETVVQFFLTQSIGEAEKIANELEATYTETVLNKFFDISQAENPEEAKQ